MRNVRASNLLRLLVFLLFAVGFGVLFGSFGPGIFQWIYNLTPNNAGRGIYEGNLISTIAVSVTGVIVGIGLASAVMRIFDTMFRSWEDMDSGDKVTLFLGVFAGLIASIPFLFLFNSLLAVSAVPFAILGLTLGFSALAVYALQSMGDVLPWNRGKGKSRRRGIKILDTNVIIDGRVYDVARTGFLEGQIYVPGFVLDELQHIADSHDPLKRQRGRRGLDVLRHLQTDFPLEVRVHDRFASDPNEEVDSRLVRLAKALGADIVTNDFNLNRVAALQDVRVLNLNDLALSMRPNVLPQESLTLTVIREGNQPNQGVGYLEDGTMVVVENGKAHIGDTMDVTVTQVIQTERGKMIFAELENDVAPGFEAGVRKRTGFRRQG